MSADVARRTFLAGLGMGLPLIGHARSDRTAPGPVQTGPITSHPDWTRQTPWRENFHLQGIMRPVADELTVDDCEVVGTIPPEMSGLLIRNGPNQRFAPPGSDYHFFDGDGMLHAMWIDGGKASYRNRWIRNRCYTLQDEAQASLWGSVLEHPLRYTRPRGESLLKPHGSINAVWQGGKMMVLDEFSQPWTVDPATLQSTGPLELGGEWTSGFTAHPKLDTRTGELVVFGYQPDARPYMRYGVMEANGTLSHNVPIELPRPIMSHDLWITDRYSVLIDVPMVFSKTRGVLTGDTFAFRPREGTRFGVIPRRGGSGDIKWFEVEPCMILHTMCAWEEGDEIVLIAPRFSDFHLNPGNFNPTSAGYNQEEVDQLSRYISCMYKWRLNMRTGRVVEEGVLDEELVEFPRINDNIWGQQTRFGYALPSDMASLVKYDLKTGDKRRHVHGDGRYSFEPIFVPHPQPESEDHGWIVAYVWDGATDTSDLVIIDAQRFDSPPVARIRLPQRVPLGPHGTWNPKGSLPWLA
jgi:carotenoid cleavage dioxygenase-like enzyme